MGLDTYFKWAFVSRSKEREIIERSVVASDAILSGKPARKALESPAFWWFG